MRLIAAKYGPRRFRLSSVSLSHLGMSTHSYPSANGLRMFPKMNLVSCAIVNASKSSFDASLFQFLPPPSLKRTKSANRNRDGDPKSEESEHLRPAKRPRVHNFAPSIAGAPRAKRRSQAQHEIRRTSREEAPTGWRKKRTSAEGNEDSETASDGTNGVILAALRQIRRWPARPLSLTAASNAPIRKCGAKFGKGNESHA